MVTAKVRRIVQGVVFAAVLVVLSGPALGQSKTTFTIPFERTGPQVFDPLTGLPIGGAFFNPCTGELVDVTGTSTITISDVVLTNGDHRTTVSVATKGTGVGQVNQVLYPFRESQSFNIRRPAAGGLALESVFTDKIHMKGPKNIDDWMLRATFRIKINDAGETLIDMMRINDEDGCTGGALTTSADSQQSPSPLPPGLVAAYSFDEGSGTTVADRSGNGNVGTLRGALFAAGKAGTALRFDGVDDWVTILDSASLDLTTGMTIEAWVQPTTAMSGWETVVLKQRGTGDLAYGLYAHDGAPLSGGVAAPAGYVNAGGAHQAIRGVSALPVDNWTHLAATYDGSVLRIYTNGALVASRSQTGTIAVSASPLRIGGNDSWAGEFFAGLIDDVRVYNRALNAAEIVADMNTRVQ